MKKLVLCSIFALTACGGGGGGGGGDDDHESSVSNSLVGVWDASNDFGADGIDEGYLSIDQNGYVSFYDYAGDTFDDWGNCYWINKNYAQITHISGTRYSVKDFETTPNESGEVEITTSRTGLRVTQPDADDEDEDGNTTEPHTFELKNSTKTIANFTPECVDSEAAARALIPAKREKLTQLN